MEVVDDVEAVPTRRQANDSTVDETPDVAVVDEVPSANQRCSRTAEIQVV